nr:MAG TPA: hypothetical protein [Caudoviricetes sp.]
MCYRGPCPRYSPDCAIVPDRAVNLVRPITCGLASHMLRA